MSVRGGSAAVDMFKISKMSDKRGGNISKKFLNLKGGLNVCCSGARLHTVLCDKIQPQTLYAMVLCKLCLLICQSFALTNQRTPLHSASTCTSCGWIKLHSTACNLAPEQHTLSPLSEVQD